MSKSRQIKFSGTIIAVRDVEDSIRATKKYTEGISTIRSKHPIQGAEFPSRKFMKYYEVYPEVDVSWDMPAHIALDWLWGETPCIDILFNYDYRANKAEVIIKDGQDAVQQLEKSIPGFSLTIATLIADAPNYRQTAPEPKIGQVGA